MSVPPRPSSLSLPAADLARIRAEAEAAYPAECCGLLVGRIAADGVLARAVAGRNLLAGESRDRFEVDPALRLRLMREFRGTPETVVGHYHSHPDHPPRPSAHDLAMVFEPDLVWLIVAVTGGHAGEAGAFLPTADQRGFDRLILKSDL
ncbi:MAG: M67 family metallopeptidase [Alphaproteobacteria bacterium]